MHLVYQHLSVTSVSRRTHHDGNPEDADENEEPVERGEDVPLVVGDRREVGMEGAANRVFQITIVSQIILLFEVIEVSDIKDPKHSKIAK